MMVPSLSEIKDARQMIANSAIRTPLVRLNIADAPAEIYLKLENLQPIGSFKIRGASNAMGHMTPESLARGVLTASAGNMAQGVAWRARELGIRCTVVSPETAPDAKIKAIERLGGHVIKAPFETWWKAFEERAFPGVEATFIHAFDDVNVMAGNGTIALEIVEDLPDVDAVVAPWGGGGLTCGIAAAMRGNRLGDVGAAIESVANQHGYGIVRPFAISVLGTNAQFSRPLAASNACSMPSFEPTKTVGVRVRLLSTKFEYFCVAASSGEPAGHLSSA